MTCCTFRTLHKFRFFYNPQIFSKLLDEKAQSNKHFKQIIFYETHPTPTHHVPHPENVFF